MNHETALGTFKAHSRSSAKFREYWTLGWPAFDSVKAERKIRKTLQCFDCWIYLNTISK